MKIRHFGLLGNRNKTKKLTLCKSLTNTKVLTKENISPLEILKKVSGKDFNLCPICKIGHLINNLSNLVLTEKRYQSLQ